MDNNNDEKLVVNVPENNNVKVVNIPTQQVINTATPQVVNVTPQVINTEQVNPTQIVNTNQNNVTQINKPIQETNYNNYNQPNKVDVKVKKGVSPLLIVLIILIIGGLGFIGYRYFIKDNVTEKKVPVNETATYGTYALPIIYEIPERTKYNSELQTTLVDGINWQYYIDNSNKAVYVHTDDLIDKEEITLPESISHYYVRSYGDYIKDDEFDYRKSSLFTNEGTKVKKVIVPNKVEIIESYAFANMESLVEVSLPISIKYIYDHAFYLSPNLSKINSKEEGTVNLPNGLKWYGTDLFVDNDVINKFTFPKDIDYINFSTFFLCSGFKDELKISGQFKYILTGGLSYLTNVKKLTLEEGVTYISGLSGSSNVTEINLPISLEAIEPDTFINYNSLKKVNYSGKLKYLGSNAITADCNENVCKKTTKDFLSLDQVSGQMQPQ